MNRDLDRGRGGWGRNLHTHWWDRWLNRYHVSSDRCV